MLREDRDVLYYGTFGAKLFAINKHTGEKLWEFDLSRGVSLNLVFDDKHVYVGSVEYIYAVNKTNGALVWQKRAEIEVFQFSYTVPLKEVSAIAVRDDVVYMLDYQGRLHAYDLSSACSLRGVEHGSKSVN